MTKADRPAWRWGPFMLLAVAGPLTAWVLYQGQLMARADWASISARQQVVQWVSGETAPTEAADWAAVRDEIQSSLDIQPDSPEFLERMGDVFSVAGQRDWADSALRMKHFSAAAAFYERAITTRPSEPGTWAMLAAARQAAGAPLASVHEAWVQAQKLGPFEGHVQPILMQVVLADWDHASPAMQAWATTLFDRVSPGTQGEINALAKRYGLQFQPGPPSAAP